VFPFISITALNSSLQTRHVGTEQLVSGDIDVPSISLCIILPNILINFHYTECQALNDNKTDHHISKATMCIAEIDTFPNTVPHKVSYVLRKSQYGTISGTTHIKTISSFSPGTDKHCIGNTLCSSDDSVTQLIHILQRFTTKNFFLNKFPDAKIEK
jgi:hypothetical protein